MASLTERAAQIGVERLRGPNSGAAGSKTHDPCPRFRRSVTRRVHMRAGNTGRAHRRFRGVGDHLRVAASRGYTVSCATIRLGRVTQPSRAELITLLRPSGPIPLGFAHGPMGVAVALKPSRLQVFSPPLELRLLAAAALQKTWGPRVLRSRCGRSGSKRRRRPFGPRAPHGKWFPNGAQKRR